MSSRPRRECVCDQCFAVFEPSPWARVPNKRCSAVCDFLATGVKQSRYFVEKRRIIEPGPR